MSKRRNRKSGPNIPQETLARARQQIAQQQETEAGEAEEEVEEVKEEAAPPPVARVEASKPARQQTTRPRSRRREGVQPARLGDKKVDTHNVAVVQNILEHPTIVVSEEELRSAYSYVLNDLRSMFALAAVLIAVLVVISFVIR